MTPSGLRRVWESGIIERAKRNEDRWLALLVPKDTEEAQAGSVERYPLPPFAARPPPSRRGPAKSMPGWKAPGRCLP